ncbi:hypothetical protein ACFL20_10540 [Spirochaetota bacterium]
MKKGIIITIILSLVIIAAPKQSHAINVGIGATTWFSWWDLKFEDQSDPDIDPAFLYGPVLSIGFTPKWKLSTVFLYGVYDTGGSDMPSDFKRYDLDVAINYILLDFLKIFGGGKFMGYDYDSGSHLAGGPAIGIGLTINLIGDLYLLTNISTGFLAGYQKDKQVDFEQNTKFYEAALNSSLSFAYVISPINTTISLGFRYQFLKTWYEGSSESYNDFISHIYGVTLTAVFSFDI